MIEFRVGQTLAILPVTLYALGFAVGPMCTSALSEEFGRQHIYKISLFLHLAFTVGGGLAQDFRTVAFCRAISGLVGSPSVSVFAGVLNDLWQMPEDRLGVPLFVLYGLGGAAAPEIGPVIGEAVVAAYGWRSSFWLTAILVGTCFVAMMFVPETFEPEILRKKLRLPRRNLREVLAPAFLRPIHLLQVEPIIPPTTAIVTMSQIVIFILYASFPVVLERNYQFSPYQVGLAFLPMLVGTLLSAPVLSMVDRRKRRLNRSVPEDNLPGAMLAALLLPISLLWWDAAGITFLYVLFLCTNGRNLGSDGPLVRRSIGFVPLWQVSRMDWGLPCPRYISLLPSNRATADVNKTTCHSFPIRCTKMKSTAPTWELLHWPLT